MNGYFVEQDILEKLDLLAYLQDMLRGLEERPEEFKGADLDEQILATKTTIESLDYDLETLAEQLAGDIRNHDMAAKAFKAESEAWKTKQYREEQRVRSEKDLLMYLMKKQNIDKMKAGKFSLTIANNGGKTPIQYAVDPEDLPSRFRIKTIVFKADDTAIREYLDAGHTSKFFEYGERGQNLRIR